MDASAQKNWAYKHKQLNKYANQHNKDPEWFKHEKHILICSWSGRPIYTRYGDETKMAAYMGVISAIISNFQRMGDNVRSIVAGEHLFVFTLIGPIYLIAISRTGESAAQLTQQLTHAHGQIISVLTGGIARVLEEDPKYDIRNLMGGTENLLTNIVLEADRSPCFLLDSVQCLRMQRTTRQRVGSALRKGKTPSLLYAVLIAGDRFVNLIRGKDRVFHSYDLLLLLNTVTNSQSLRSSESWTPICLPKFSDRGYLYAYVCYLAEDVSLSLITGSDSAFSEMQEAKVRILEDLNKKGCLEEIKEALEFPDLDVDLVDTGVPELRHFVYKSEVLSQLMQSAYGQPFTTKRAQKQLFRRYQHIYSRLQQGNTLYYEVSEVATLAGWQRPGEFYLFASFTPLVSKENVLVALNRILRWVKREEPTLFIM